MLSWHAYQSLPNRRASAGPGSYLGSPALARHGLAVVFTNRVGGVSVAPHASLNLSYVSGDDRESVRTNRALALSALGLGAERWTGGKQVHGAGVAHVTESECGRGADSADSTIPETDALWTDQPGIALAVLVADCLPILLADPRRRRIAVVHAGWRGLVAGVVGKAAAVFEDPSDIVALAGPSIGPCCYEVGADVAVPATERFGAGVMRGSHLDLWAGVAIAFKDAGIRRAQIAGLCTRCESHRFYSHRAGDTGRQGVLACLLP